MKLAERVACMGKEKLAYKELKGNLRERDHWGDPGIDGKIIIRWIFKKEDVGYRLD
jgi:hypothetical protein